MFSTNLMFVQLSLIVIFLLNGTSCLKPKPGTERQKDLSASVEKMKKKAVVDETNASNENGSGTVGELFSMVEEMQTSAKTVVDSANVFNEDNDYATNLLQKYAVPILCYKPIEKIFENVGNPNFNEQLMKQTGIQRDNLCQQLENGTNIDESVKDVENIKNKFVANLYIEPQIQNLIKVTKYEAFNDKNKEAMLKLIRTFIQTGAKLKENKQMMIPFIKLPQQNRKTKVSGGIIRRKRAHDIECGPSGGCMRRWTKTQKCVGGIVFGSISAGILVMSITLLAQHPEIVNRHPLPALNFIALLLFVVLMIACFFVFVVSVGMVLRACR